MRWECRPEREGEEMAQAKPPAVEVDMLKDHHWLVVVSAKHDVLHVTCVDCDESREYPYRYLGAFNAALESTTDVQVLSWIDCDAR